MDARFSEDAMEVTQNIPADVRGRIIRASILPIEDEATMIARLRAGAEAVERGELDAEDFAGIWSQHLRELFRRASSVPAPADVRERVARECVEEAERLGRWYGDGYAKARSLLREAAALLLTPRGDEEAWRAFLDALDEVETTAASLWAEPEGPTAEDMERLDQARQRVIECARALVGRRSDAQGGEEDALDLIRWAEAHHAALEPVAGNIMPPGTYACYAGDADEPYMGPGILGAIRAARRSEGSA